MLRRTRALGHVDDVETTTGVSLEKRRALRVACVAGVLLLGAALRLALLDRIPPGLSHDEAYNGVTAIEVLLLGRRAVFFDIYNGIEPLIIYWEALYFHLFGIVPVAMRLVDFTAGMLTIAVTYVRTREMFSPDRLQRNSRRRPWTPG